MEWECTSLGTFQNNPASDLYPLFMQKNKTREKGVLVNLVIIKLTINEYEQGSHSTCIATGMEAVLMVAMPIELAWIMTSIKQAIYA